MGPKDDVNSSAFTGETRFHRVFAGTAARRCRSNFGDTRGDLRGTKHITAEDTFEGDYGRIIESAQRALESGKSMASPAGVEPASPP